MAAARDQSGLTTCIVLVVRSLWRNAHIVTGAYIAVIVDDVMCQSFVMTVSNDIHRHHLYFETIIYFQRVVTVVYFHEIPNISIHFCHNG